MDKYGNSQKVGKNRIRCIRFCIFCIRFFDQEKSPEMTANAES